MRLSILPPLLILFASAASPAAMAVPASVENVTVYPDRAVVTRVATVSVPAGVSGITVPGLPDSLLDESLQVSVRSRDALSIIDVRVATRHGAVGELERLKPLLDKQKALQEKMDQTRLELELLRQQQGFLSKVEDSVTTGRTEGELPTSQQWGGLMAFFRESLSELLPRIHEIETLRKKVQEEHDAVTQEIAQTRRGEQARSKEAVVRVEAAAATEGVRLALSYVVMNAGWSPAYNVRVDSAGKSIRLEYEAMVRQRSGEDWDGVNLTLSTARPALGANPPDLRPWIVDVRQPPPPRPVAMMAPASRTRSGEAGAFFSFEDKVEAEFVPAEVETGLTAVNLRVPVSVSVPADGQPHRVGVTSVSLEGGFFYTILPKLSPHAFLQARVTHAGQAPILPGRAAVFLDGNLTGHSRLPRVEPDGEFDLSLGVDEAILVERKLLRRFVDQRGLLSKTTRTRFEFLTTVTNRRTTAEKLVIKDHVPVSMNERIKVALLELSGGVADGDNPGFYTWEKTVAAGAKLEIPLTFTVEHPEDLDVTGLGAGEGW